MGCLMSTAYSVEKLAGMVKYGYLDLSGNTEELPKEWPAAARIHIR